MCVCVCVCQVAENQIKKCDDDHEHLIHPVIIQEVDCFKVKSVF